MALHPGPRLRRSLLLAACASLVSPLFGQGAPGLVGAWRFDEGEIPVVIDSSGSGNHGGLRGAVRVPAGAAGRASPSLAFEGSGADVLVHDSGSLGVTTSFTMTAWIRPSLLDREQVVFSSPGGSWVCDLSQANTLRLWTPVGPACTGRTAIQDTQSWRHVAVVKNGDAGTNIAFYLNGNPDGDGSIGALQGGSGFARIGSTDSRWWAGLLDDVKVWNRALSAAEIQAEFQGPPSGPATTVVVTDQVQRADVRRLGINLGGYNYWDSGQIMANLLHRNPGFEGEVFRSIVRCSVVNPGTWSHDYTGWPDGFWNSASFEVLQGATVGRTGRIAHYSPAGAQGVFTLAGGSDPPAVGDYVAVIKMTNGGAPTGWWTHLQGQASITTETNDLAPDSPGRQAIRLSAQNGGDVAELSSHMDTWQGQTFLQLVGNHRLSFKAKGVGGNRRVQVLVRRLSTPLRTYLDQTLTLGPDWSTRTVDFSVAERADAVGTLTVVFHVEDNSTVLLDDASLVNMDDAAVNPTAFRLEAVNALRDLRPGILRYWGGQLGDTLDNQVAEPFARRRTAFSFWVNEADQIEYGLHEFLVLCDTIGAEPWYVVPTAFSTDEMRDLIEYLAGPAGTPWADRRAARGRAAPWTEAFRKIHLELGNEAWNPLFGGGIIDLPDAYGQRGHAVFQAARSSVWFVHARFDLILGGQAVWPGRNQMIHLQSQHHDSLALAPYLLGKVDSFGQPEEFFGPLLAEPELIVRAGASCPPEFHCNYMRRNHDAMQASSRPVELSVYEVNLHTTEGAITWDQPALDRYLPSLGSGLAVAQHMLLMLRELGIRNQAMFSLHQYSYGIGSPGPIRNYARLWGTVRDLGVTNRRRPQFLAMRLANQALRGDLVQTIHQGADPTWDQPALNGVVLNGAHHLHSYAFADGSQRALILMNLHRTDAQSVTFNGPNRPEGTVEERRLSAPSITSSDENDQVLMVSARTIAGFDPWQMMSLPPTSMTVLHWQVGGAAPARRAITAGVPRMGTTVPLDLSDPQNPGNPYLLGAALGTKGFPLAKGLRMPLNGDPVFWASVTPPHMGLTGSIGYLDGNGRAAAAIPIPYTPSLEGFVLHTAFVAFDHRLNPQAVTDAYALTIVR